MTTDANSLLPPLYGVLEDNDLFFGVEVEGDFKGEGRATWDEAVSDCWHNFFGCTGVMPLDTE